MTILYKDYIGEMTQVDGATGVTSMLDLSTIEIIIMCSLLCATDVIAAVSLIKPEKQPKLFSLLFGEGITNDAVAIILFNAVVNFSRTNEELNTSAVISISTDFLALVYVRWPWASSLPSLALYYSRK